jgi:Tfp pilus assembly protein PilO
MIRKGASGVDDMERRESKWQLDKHIPISVLVALVIQTGTFIWWASKLENRVANLEQQRIESREQTSTLPERITKLEVQQAYANQLLIDVLREMRNPAK